MAQDYPLVGPASVTLPQFAAILTSAGSPAASEAPGMYAAIRRYGIDPAVVLAIMQHESSFGRLGIAVGRNNPTGSRYYAGAAAFGAVDRGGWAAFPTWSAGVAYTSALLASSNYAGDKRYSTAATFAQRYAPSSDGNNPVNYGRTVVGAINRWTGSAPASAPAPAPAQLPPAPARPTATPNPVMPFPVGTALGILGLTAILIVLLIKR